jgi:DNA-binding MarR family transcriptional regulator
MICKFILCKFCDFGIFGMKLTRRQEIFINRLLDQYRELREPMHYTDLAERLGVSSYTAYYMLRLLEEKGYVESIYKARGEGPGRSIVLFQPTPKARATFERLISDQDKDWETVKKQIIANIQTGDIDDPDLVDAMLNRIPESAEDNVAYCAAVIGTLASRIRDEDRKRTFCLYLNQVSTATASTDKEHLSLLPGFLLGLTASQKDDPDHIQNMLETILRFADTFETMGNKRRSRLAELLVEILEPLPPN